jgi:hypothetical protein
VALDFLLFLLFKVVISFFVRRVTLVTSESAKNALGQEVFGRKGKEVPVEQSPAASTADVSFQPLGGGVTAASEAEKGGASGSQPVKGRQEYLCMSDLPPTLHQQTTETGGPDLEGDNDRRLYVRTPWENDVIADHHDINDFKEASRTIVRTLSVRC